MGSLLSGLSELLKVEEPEREEGEEGPTAMDLALQAAIEKRAAEQAAASGEATSLQPNVTVIRSGARPGVFGRRAVAPD